MDAIAIAEAEYMRLLRIPRNSLERLMSQGLLCDALARLAKLLEADEEAVQNEYKARAVLGRAFPATRPASEVGFGPRQPPLVLFTRRVSLAEARKMFPEEATRPASEGETIANAIRWHR